MEAQDEAVCPESTDLPIDTNGFDDEWEKVE